MGCLPRRLACITLLVAPATWADEHRGAARLEALRNDFNSRNALQLSLTADWKPVGDDGREQERWAELCAELLEAAEAACSWPGGKPVQACLAELTARVDTFSCLPIVQENKARELALELKGKTVVVRRGAQANASTTSAIPNPLAHALTKALPQLAALTRAAHIDAELAKLDKGSELGTELKLVVDHQSFEGVPLDPAEVARDCAIFWSAAALFNEPDCNFKMCEGDQVRGQAFLKRLKTATCSYGKPGQPYRLEGDALAYGVAQVGNAENMFLRLRKPAQVRGCARDLTSLAPGSLEESECCPRDANKRCMQPREKPLGKDCSRRRVEGRMQTMCAKVVDRSFTEAQRRTAR